MRNNNAQHSQCPAVRFRNRTIQQCRWFTLSLLTLSLGAVLILSQNLASLSQPLVSPLMPHAAENAFELDPGLTVNLVAAEPLVVAPCALAWDAQGRLYVAENRGYPTGSKDKLPLGTIALLEDMDGDGLMDKRTLFESNLTFPNGLMAWNGGLIVTCAPDILFLKDVDGDGKSDIRRVLLTGFDTRNSTQLRVANPTLGSDGWIYLTSGLARVGNITSPAYPSRPSVRVGTDSRFDPFTFQIETLDSRGQFGHTFDAWGNRFHCMNRIHIQHTVISRNLLERNPNVAFSETVQNVPESMVDDLLKSRNLAARTYPISENITTADSHAGTFSAACSVHVYRGNELPAVYNGNVFTCDPTGNLVHRDTLTPVGPTFSSRIANEGREFFASRDNWFRPVFVTTGPDGALYVCDMYRSTIEHPDYLPTEVRKRTNFEAGRNMGRIWRIASTEEDHLANAVSKLAIRNSKSTIQNSYDTPALVDLLAHENVWQRETAARLLIERQATDAIPILLRELPRPDDGESDDSFLRRKRMAQGYPASLDAVHRIAALNSLITLSRWDPVMEHEDSIMASDPETGREIFRRLLYATVDEFPGVRFTAWRWLRRIPGPGPKIADEIPLHWAEDPNSAVRFQIAVALAQWDGNTTVQALLRIALQDGANKWTRSAIFSGLNDRELVFLDRLGQVELQNPPIPLMFELGKYLGNLTGKRVGLNNLNRFFSVQNQADSKSQFAFWAGVIESTRHQSNDQSRTDLLASLGFTGSLQSSVANIAIQVLNDGGENLQARQTAARFLSFARNPKTIELFFKLLERGHAPELQHTVVTLLPDLPIHTVSNKVLNAELWNSLTPRNRNLLIAGLLSREATTIGLLTAIRSQSFPVNALSIAQRNRLLKHKADHIRKMADELFAVRGGNRMRVYEQFKSLVSMQGNSGNGKVLFIAQCASCHRLEREGANVGPDLFGIRNQSKEVTLLHILAPNYEVLTGFSGYEIETKDGRSLSGLLSSETDSSLTMRMAYGVEESVARSDIRSLRATSLSLMPEGFEETMSRQDLADLLAFLKGESSN